MWLAVELGGALAVAAVFAGSVGAVIVRQRRLLAEHADTIARHARTDHLTGVGNRRAFEEAAARLGDRRHALVAVDIDGMRLTNSAYGYAAGDEHLVSVARVLHDVCEGDDVAARLGGDMFVLLLPDGDDRVAADRAERVRAAMHGVAVSRGSVRVSIGCGSVDPGVGPLTSLALAEDALVAAKGGGGDRVVAGQPGGAWRGWRLRRLSAVVEAMLADASMLRSVYQRVVRIDDRTSVGWEGLARPLDWAAEADVEALFLFAQRMGAERELDWRCRRSALWGAATLEGPLFVNVNVTGLVDPLHGVDQMELMCEWARRPPSAVVLELSERESVPDLSRLQQTIADYRAAGFRFALDDIGEGHTTLELIVAARPEFLKVARPLIRAAGTDPTACAAARAVVGFAHDIGSLVVAEGVEDEAVLSTCLELGIDLGQGWLFGRPQAAGDLRTR
jgi:diguanylate cyclase (GGDEF)-like protein